MGAETSTLLPELDTGEAALALGSADADETLLLQILETFVYSIPARPRSDGHVAASWGLDAPAVTGRLRVTSLGARTVIIALWRESDRAAAAPRGRAATSITLSPASNGFSLVALSRFEVGPGAAHALEHWLEPVVDSSRYFALRCVGRRGGGAAAAGGAAAVETRVLGIGFRERETAFALKAALADFTRSVLRQSSGRAGEEGTAPREGVRTEGDAEPASNVAAARAGRDTAAEAAAAARAAAAAAAAAEARARLPRAPVLRPPPPSGQRISDPRAAVAGADASAAEAPPAAPEDGLCNARTAADTPTVPPPSVGALSPATEDDFGDFDAAPAASQ